jgi:hypothetical protein
MAFMQTMFKAYVNANKKAGKSKKRKKCNNDSSDSCDSEQETGYGNMGFSVDKHLKLDTPLGTVYLSTEPRLIKVVNTASSNNTRAGEIVIKTTKTGKVTAVVAVMSIFLLKGWNLRSANSGNEKLSHQKGGSANVLEENSRRLRNLSLKTRKGWLPIK